MRLLAASDSWWADIANDGDLAQAEQLLKSSITLVQETAESWAEVWKEAISTDSELWAALCKFGMFIAALCLILVSLKMAHDFKEGKLTWAELAGAFVWPLVIVLFIGGQGNLLAQNVLFLKSVFSSQIVEILKTQASAVTFERAIAEMAITNGARQQLASLLSECQGKPPEPLKDCINSKQSEIDQIVSGAEKMFGGVLQGLRDFTASPAALAAFPWLAPFQASSAIFNAFLVGIQWAFINGLEAALLLTALLAPVAMGLSLLPLGSRAIWAWGSGFMGLFSVQLGYTILVGLMSTVLVKGGAQSISDIAFLAFIGLFAPGLALLLGGGGGVALYVGMQRYGMDMVNFAVNSAKIAVMAFV
jgi:hypothetical protein